MDEYTITRDGQRDLKFTGEKLAEVNNKWVAGRENNRWHELTLYRTAGGKYVLQEVYRTMWQGELDSNSATICDTAEEVLAALTNEEGTLHNLDKELLQQAARNDQAFAGLWEETLE